VAPRTAIDQPGPKRQGRLDIADAIVDAWTEALCDGELALEYLASPTNGAERIALDDLVLPPETGMTVAPSRSAP
jgi:hypothetical protein